MDILYGLYLIAFVALFVKGLEEHCIMETFRAQCEASSVVLMTKATYGLMKKSRCIQGNPSDFGCSVNVLPFMDKECSGKNTCQYLVPQPELYDVRCTQDIASAAMLYLESEYTCIDVAEPPDNDDCEEEKSISLSDTTGYLSGNTATTPTSRGLHCPWMIKGHLGQRIDISIIDFQPNEATSMCVPIAYIFDTKSKENRTVCKPAERNKHVYISQGDSVQIQIDRELNSQQGIFLIHYKVVGCADLIAPEDSWYKRTGGLARVGCHKQNKTWVLSCHGNTWDGVVGTCDSSGVNGNTHDISTQQADWSSLFGIPIEILITAVAGLVLIFLVCIIALVVRSKCRHDNNQAIYNQSTVSSSGGYATAKPHTRSSWACTYKAGRQHQVDTHIWETPLPEPSATSALTAESTMRHDNPPIPSAMLDSMAYTMPVPSIQPQSADLTQTDYTQPVKVSEQQNISSTHSAEPPLPLNPRHSEANYYYYDPSQAVQVDYMQPGSSHTNDGSTALSQLSSAQGQNIQASNLPTQETRECDYRTLIKMENDKS